MSVTCNNDNLKICFWTLPLSMMKETYWPEPQRTMLPIPSAQWCIPPVPGTSQTQSQPSCFNELPGQVKTSHPPPHFLLWQDLYNQKRKTSAKQVLSFIPLINLFPQGILLSSTLIFPPHILPRTKSYQDLVSSKSNRNLKVTADGNMSQSALIFCSLYTK